MTAKIDVWADASHDLLSGKPLGYPSPYMVITQDNDAHTIIPGPEDRRAVFETAARGEPFKPLAVLYLLDRSPKRTLIVGAGGGKDVVTAACPAEM